ncbi:MAG: membrane protein insertase YidC, partial [Myxococcaceae bacterium]
MENQSQKRTAVAFGLIFLLTAVYMTWFAPTPPPPQASAGAVDAGAVASSPAPVVAPPVAVQPPPTSPSDRPPPAGPAVRTVEGLRKTTHYVFSTEGAGLLSARLRGEKTRDQVPLTIPQGWAQLLGKEVPKGPEMDLAQPVAGGPLPLSVELAGEATVPANLRYSAEQGDHRITFVGRTESWEITKEVSWVEDGYELATRITLRNLTGRSLSGELVFPYPRAIDPVHEEKPSMFGGVGNVS